MTIAALDPEIKGVISKHSVYGAEAVVNALVRACDGHQYLQREDLIELLDNAYKRLAVDKAADDFHPIPIR